MESAQAQRLRERLGALGAAFGLRGELTEAAPLGRGHIHETYLSVWRDAKGLRRFVHQRLNTHVFPDPVQLMRNVERVTKHLRAELRARGVDQLERRVLELMPARGGRSWVVDDTGAYWRTTRYVERTRSDDRIRSAEQAVAAARAFGHFARMLAGLDPGALPETLAHFHDLPARVRALEASVARDVRGRARSVSAELEASRRAHALLRQRFPDEAGLPRRLVHNDCKLDNLLLDRESGEPLCVVDLDTVMPGTLLCDFGELVRTGASTGAEDERRLERIDLDLGLFAGLARGYVEGLGDLASELELRSLAYAGPRLALENAVRFLTDHLEGDRYFRIAREGHNLDRARAQLRLSERMLDRLAPTLEIVEREAARAART